LGRLTGLVWMMHNRHIYQHVLQSNIKSGLSASSPLLGESSGITEGAHGGFGFILPTSFCHFLESKVPSVFVLLTSNKCHHHHPPLLSPLMVGDQKSGRGGAPKKSIARRRKGETMTRKCDSSICRFRESVGAFGMLGNACID
jgi:hypothetical protein